MPRCRPHCKTAGHLMPPMSCSRPYNIMRMQVTLASSSGVGPFARLRAGAAIDTGAYIGNFVELKGAHVGQGGNVCHLSYLGDADVGDRANIGAGTITCNYSEHTFLAAFFTLDSALLALHAKAQRMARFSPYNEG